VVENLGRQGSSVQDANGEAAMARVLTQGEAGPTFIAGRIEVNAFRARQGEGSRGMSHDMAGVWRQGGR
jgi:hypothetical protein